MAEVRKGTNEQDIYVSSPIGYNYKTKNRGILNTTFITEFDTSSKETFVYQQAYVAGVVVSRNLVVKASTNGKYVTQPDVDNDLRYLLANDQNLKRNLDSQTRNGIDKGLQTSLGKKPSRQQVDETFGRAPGTGSDASTQSQQGSTPGPTQENLNTLSSKGIPGKPPRLNYGDLYYPTDLRKSKSDAIKFTMIRYGTKTYNAETLGFGERSLPKGQTEEIKGMVMMSIQPTISDNNYANWSGQEMGMLATAAAGASLEIIDTGNTGSLGRAIGNTLDKESGLKDAILAVAAQEAASTKGLLTRLTGAMFNNNLELLFMGPQLRQFTFSFKMSPRYKEEAEEVTKIIRFFKQGSAVQRSTTNLFLKSPNVFKLEYLHRKDKDASHKSLNKIKTCALVNKSVDYTPTGSYMTFNDADGSMVSYTLSLTFNELEPIYEDDYQKLDDGQNDSGGVGY